jgi:hypothetical protein
MSGFQCTPAAHDIIVFWGLTVFLVLNMEIFDRGDGTTTLKSKNSQTNLPKRKLSYSYSIGTYMWYSTGSSNIVLSNIVLSNVVFV